MCDFAHGRRDGSWLTFSSHGTYAVILLLLQGFQGKTQTAENDRVRSSMKYMLPIGSLPAWYLPTAGELHQYSHGVDHPCMWNDLLALARNAAAWSTLR